MSRSVVWPEAEFRRFVDQYRSRCLWFLREDYYPETSAEREDVLRQIEQHGDREAFGRVAQFRTWLSQDSSETVCRLLAERRRVGGESYVAGGIALNVALEAHRLSRDLDLDAKPDGTRYWNADPGILTRAAGIALALLAATTSLEPTWDRMLLVSTPRVR